MSDNEKELSKKEIVEKAAQYPTSLANLILTYGINPKYLSYLEKTEFFELMNLIMIADIYGVEYPKKFVKEYIEMRVSMEGRGRKDVVEISKRASQKLLQEFYERMKTYREKEF